MYNLYNIWLRKMLITNCGSIHGKDYQPNQEKIWLALTPMLDRMERVLAIYVPNVILEPIT